MKADSNSNNMNALVAQLDRVTGYEPVGRGFESLQPYQQTLVMRGNATGNNVRGGVLVFPLLLSAR